MPERERERDRERQRELETAVEGEAHLLKFLWNKNLPKLSSDSCHRFVERVFI
jgi:hypothetical protein